MSTKLYFFECGTLKSEKHLFTMNRGTKEPFEVPVLFFLIRHNGKNILFDTGNAYEVATDPRKHWGDTVDVYYPVMKKEQFVANQLKELGVEPGKIDYVILSHLHLDHAGGVGAFPNATYVAHKKEIDFAFCADCPQKDAYIIEDIGKDVKWLALENEFEQAYDLLGDGSIKIYPTPGHTPGHISVLVDLKKPMLLTSDSCYTDENLNDNLLPGLFWNEEASARTINWIRKIQKEQNIEVVTGHNPYTWDKFKKAPEYYS